MNKGTNRLDMKRDQTYEGGEVNKLLRSHGTLLAYKFNNLQFNRALRRPHIRIGG
jgi:hypothetical protein